ncbi:pyruvoyl-dependent arginine decarboxylase [Candidatus Woesearchaeota archaeon]|nr:pyruvoyl-dependent arginine decarboxylase [Candidatus Woesearchaeota archaeon]
MKIIITLGIGDGPTELSAFDNALHQAGIANYNLIRLSSVIPAGSEIIDKKIDWNNKEYGHRLYLVYSECSASEPGKEAWAGLGWITEEKTGKGLLVEHHGPSEAEVKKQINDSLKRMQEYRPDKYGKISHKVVGIKCKGKPVCAIVAAVYKSEGWN